MSNTPKAKITEENLEESRRLKSIWDDTGHDGLTQDAFGEKYGIGSQAAVGFFLNGKSAISMKAAIGFAKGLGRPISEFSPRLAAVAQDASAVNQIHSSAVNPDLIHSSTHPAERRAAMPSLARPSYFAEMLGHLFDAMPDELDLRAKAFSRCQQALDEVMQERRSQQMPAPIQSRTSEKSTG